MKSFPSRLAVCAASCLLLGSLSARPAEAQFGVGLDPSQPAPVGHAVKNVVQCGSSPVALEPYDITATVTQVLRGKAALDALKAANPATAAPKAGSEYLLAHVKIDMQARLRPGNKTFQVGVPLQWVALSTDGYEYPPTPTATPQPALTGNLRAGSPLEGWVAFQVAQTDRAPMLSFDPSSGGGTRRGVVYFFRLQ